jgi:uncharacterized protein (TIGR00369 family)
MELAVLRQVIEELIPFNKYLGVQVRALERGRTVLEIPWRDELIGDPVRQAVHGGVISMLADTAGGAVVWGAIENPASRVSTIDLRIDYLRPGRQETLVAEASIVRLGKRVAVTDVRIFHPSAPLDTIATGKAVYNIVLSKAAFPP